MAQHWRDRDRAGRDAESRRFGGDERPPYWEPDDPRQGGGYRSQSRDEFERYDPAAENAYYAEDFGGGPGGRDMRRRNQQTGGGWNAGQAAHYGEPGGSSRYGGRLSRENGAPQDPYSRGGYGQGSFTDPSGQGSGQAGYGVGYGSRTEQGLPRQGGNEWQGGMGNSGVDPELVGVRSYRGRGPKGYERSVERVKEDACERLTEAPDVDASDISVDCREGGIIVLEGSVPDRQMKHRAEDIVEACYGVKDIDNRLRVSGRIEQPSEHGITNQNRLTEGGSLHH